MKVYKWKKGCLFGDYSFRLLVNNIIVPIIIVVIFLLKLRQLILQLLYSSYDTSSFSFI